MSMAERKPMTFDRDGYPTTASLRRIRRWEYDTATLADFICMIHEVWRNGFILKSRGLTLVTGGWSGDEDVIHALSDNMLFWRLHCVAWRSGGRYDFRLSQGVVNKVRERIKA